MKYIIIILVSLVLFAQKGYTQFKTPLFEMPIYFEDAKGHKDSIIMGFDENADFEKIDSLFGEDKLLTPFDSVFDVRVVKSGSAWDSPITGKKRIDRKEISSSGFGGFRLSIVINAKYNPIKISYNKDLMKQEKPYMFKTILAKTSHIFLKESGWYYANDWVCLAGQKSQTVDMTKKDGVDFWNVRKYRIVGENNLKEIKFLYLTQFSSGPACENILSDKAVENTEIMTYPNPVQSELHFMLAEDIFSTNTTYQIFDVNGKAIQKASVTNNDVNIDVESFPQGMYFIKVYDGNKILANARFIKVE